MREAKKGNEKVKAYLKSECPVWATGFEGRLGRVLAVRGENKAAKTTKMQSQKTRENEWKRQSQTRAIVSTIEQWNEWSG